MAIRMNKIACLIYLTMATCLAYAQPLPQGQDAFVRGGNVNIEAGSGKEVYTSVGGDRKYTVPSSGLGVIGIPNQTYFAGRNAAASSWLNMLGIGSLDETRVIGSSLIHLAIGGGGGTAQWSVSTSSLSPITDNVEDIGSTTIGVKVAYVRNLQAPTGANTLVLARNGHIDLYTIDSDNTPLKRWRVDATSGGLLQDATNGGPLVMSVAGTSGKGVVIGSAAVNADISSIATPLVNIFQDSGFGTAITRGSANATSPIFALFKSRAVDGSADTVLQSGDSTGEVQFWGADGSAFRQNAVIKASVGATPGASDMPGKLEFQISPDGSATPGTAFTINNDSTAVFTSTITSTRTTDIGWAVVDGTDNTACTAQCTNAAVFGFNLAAGATQPVIVGPSDATADICLCAGAS